VLGVATVLVEASMIVGARVLERMCIGATVLKATVVMGATVLGGAWCSEVDSESVGDMDSRNRIGTGRCEKSSSNFKHIYMYILHLRFNKDSILVQIKVNVVVIS
jgi:hypothetical protein